MRGSGTNGLGGVCLACRRRRTVNGKLCAECRVDQAEALLHAAPEIGEAFTAHVLASGRRLGETVAALVRALPDAAATASVWDADGYAVHVLDSAGRILGTVRLGLREAVRQR